ncbi:hypothetical protein LSUCC1028_12140, partial [Rhodobacterales bacterium LSUCC1028]|nr:hypothetical protein [Rhodobacterales bacterium LSUCC1028]
TAAAEALDAGDVVTDVFTYTVSDDGGSSDTGTLTITVTGQNEPSYLTVDMAAGPFLDDGSVRLEAFGTSGQLLFSVQKDGSKYSVIDGAADAEILNVNEVSSRRAISGINADSIEEFRFEINGYSGEIALRLAQGANFIDEATAQITQSDIDLRAIVDLPFGANKTVSITPFSEMAVQFIGKALGFGTEIGSRDFLTSSDTSSVLFENYEIAADLVQQATGVDIQSDRVIATNDNTRFRSVIEKEAEGAAANQYGLKLAALSKLYSGDAVGEGVSKFVSGIEINVSESNILGLDRADSTRAKAQLTDAQNTYSLDNKILFQFSDGGVITQVVSSDVSIVDAIAPVSATVTSLGNNATDFFAEGKVDLIDNLNAAGVADYLEVDLFFNGMSFSAVYDTVSQSYVSDSLDFEILNFDRETGEAIWRFASSEVLPAQVFNLDIVVTDSEENASLVSEVVDLRSGVPPTVNIEISDPIFLSGETTSVQFLFSEDISGFEISDILLDHGSLSNLVQDVDNSKLWTADMSASVVDSKLPLILTLPEDSVQDADGNGNVDASVIYAVLAASDSITQPTQSDDFLATNSNGSTLHGLAGDDVLIGSAGDDNLVGDTDDDLLVGKAGDDIIIGAAGDDISFGGTGDDTYYFDNFESNHNYQDIFVGGADYDIIEFEGDISSYQIGLASLAQVELINKLIIEGVAFRGISSLTGFDQDTPVFFIQKVGATSSSSLHQSGFLQAEYLNFNDVGLEFVQLSDELRIGDFGADIVLTVSDSSSALLFQGLSYVNVDADPLKVLGGNANDTLISGFGNDVLAGAQGQDIIVSLGGSDRLYGDAGDDTLLALNSGQLSVNSSVTLEGGIGNDVFVILPTGSNLDFDITISDFSIDDDVINIENLYSSDDMGVTLEAVTVDSILDAAELDILDQTLNIDLSDLYIENGEAVGSLNIEIRFSGPKVLPPDVNQDLINIGLPDNLQSDWWNSLLIEHGYTGGL